MLHSLASLALLPFCGRICCVRVGRSVVQVQFTLSRSMCGQFIQSGSGADGLLCRMDNGTWWPMMCSSWATCIHLYIITNVLSLIKFAVHYYFVERGSDNKGLMLVFACSKQYLNDV